MKSFTVVIPTFNRPERTVRAVESVLAQSHEAVTVIVVDDGSTDDTVERVRALTDARLTVLQQPNAGAPTARNLGARHAATDYLTFLDSDDTVAPHWLARWAEAALEGVHSPKVLSCGFEVRSSDPGEPAKLRRPGPVPCWPGVRACFGHAGTFAVTPELFRSVGGYNPEVRAGQHTELAFRLLDSVSPSEIATIDDPLLQYWASGADNIRGNDAAVAAGALYMLRVHADAVARDRSYRANLLGMAGVRSIRAGESGAGRRYLWHGALLEPWKPRRVAMALTASAPRLASRRWPPSR